MGCVDAGYPTRTAPVTDVNVDTVIDKATCQLPGAEAAVGFGEFDAVIAGAPLPVRMFVMHLSHSGRRFHVAYGNPAQGAFLQGHAEAFAPLEWSPAGSGTTP